MAILTGVLAAGRPPWDDSWYESASRPTAAGVAVSPDSALTLSALYGGVTYVSEDVAKIPLNMYEDLGDKGNRPARDHYLQSKLHDQPNRYQTALEFREMMTAFAMLRRYGIAEKRTPPGGRPVIDDDYIPLHPDLVREETLTSTRERVYRYRDPLKNFEERTLLEDEVLVLRGRLGRSLMDFARESIGIAQAQERHVGNTFGRGAKFGGVILRDKPWSDPERRNFRKALNQYATSGQYSGRPLLLEDGMTWQDVGMTNADAELVDSRRFSVLEFCRWIRIPPHKLFELERSTNNNIERQSVDYVVDSLLGWTERWEQVILRDLITLRERGRFFAEHNLDGLMRGDIKARYEAYALAVQWGWMVRNEVRAKENLNPLDGLDEPLTPLNMNRGANGSVAIGYAEPKALGSGSPSPELLGRLKLHASDAAARVIRREIAAVAKAADRAGDDQAAFRSSIETFYAEHADHVARTLHIAEHDARRYALEHRDAVLDSGIRASDDWLVDAAQHLTSLAMDQQEIAA